MKKLILSALFATGLVAGIEAAPTETFTQADLQAIIQRLNLLEAENKAQAKRIAELERAQQTNVCRIDDFGRRATQLARKFEIQAARMSTMAKASFEPEADTTTNETGRIYTTSTGKHYYLADASAHIFEPLSESGL